MTERRPHSQQCNTHAQPDSFLRHKRPPPRRQSRPPLAASIPQPGENKLRPRALTLIDTAIQN